MIINEWQLDSKLNAALQQAQRADFALFLALLSPAVEESAEFFTPEAKEEVSRKDLYQQFGVMAERNFAMHDTDPILMRWHSEALQAGGLAQLKLMSSLNAAPMAFHDDNKRIDSDVWQNCSLHSRRRILQQMPVKPEANPAALYEVLQQLNSAQAA
jgi:hypothetical protein